LSELLSRCAVLSVLRDWQTLAAGVLAILGAMFGGWVIWRQTNVVDRRVQATLNRQYAAARSVLPLALSALAEYSKDCASSLRLRISSHTSCNNALPTFDPKMIFMLRDVVESTENIVSERISTIISDVQILAARLRSLSDPNFLATKLSLEMYIANAAVIYSRCEDLFSYARRETDETPAEFPRDERLDAALSVMGFNDPKYRAALIDRAKRAPRPQRQ
jgi:hypothetical protein